MSPDASSARAAAARVGWLTGLAVAAALTVNIAGLWAIAVARRGARDEAQRAFDADLRSLAGAVDRRLSSIRTDLAFVAAASPIARLGEPAAGSAAGLHKEGAESALLLFLRSHPEVVRVMARSASGRALFHIGRRGGVPVLWVSSAPTGLEGAAVAPGRPRLLTRLDLADEGLSLEAEVEPTVLLAFDEGAGRPLACDLRDATGSTLVRPPRRRRADAASAEVTAASEVPAEGWTPAVPWSLRCAQPALALGLFEPVAARHRTLVVLNVAVMALALLLGGFAVQQAWRRERLEVERQLFHAERLATVGRLAAGIAHEINNPLEGMANYLVLARRALDGSDAEGAKRYLAGTREGLERAAGVVRQVLALADPARGPHTTVDLNQVLRETGRFVESRKEFSKVAFSFDLAEGPLAVHGSPAMLGQVAVNLILNACEAQPEGGEVRVSTRREGERVVAEFADRGHGVAEADRERIFEPFFSTKESTGLGLSICHSIVRQHAGELTALPRDGGGAVFRVALPALEARV
jgi:signal transduction histidine kinase